MKRQAPDASFSTGTRCPMCRIIMASFNFDPLIDLWERTSGGDQLD